LYGSADAGESGNYPIFLPGSEFVRHPDQAVASMTWQKRQRAERPAARLVSDKQEAARVSENCRAD
jgi:hypothetical protein